MKKIVTCIMWVASELLSGCQQVESSREAYATSQSPVPATASPALAVPDTAAKPIPDAGPSAALLYAPLRSSADTLLHSGGRQLWLQLQARLDTTQRLAIIKGQDTITSGYQGYFTFVLRDSLHRLMARRVLTKPLFYKTVGPGLAISSRASLPVLLGYSTPLHALVFTINFTAPDTDWSCDAVLLLDLQGRVRRLREGYSVGGPAVEVGLAHDGRTIVTGTEILRVNGPALPLQRPNAELRGALLLNDSLVVTMYEFGHYQAERSPEGYVSQGFTSTPSQQRQPNAFVVNTHTGQTINRFRYKGFFEGLGFTIPWHRLPATRTGYFLDDKKGLYLLSEAQPTRTGFRSLASLVKFKPPQRPSEVAFDLHGYTKTYMLYVDTLAPASIRYQYERTALD